MHDLILPIVLSLGVLVSGHGGLSLIGGVSSRGGVGYEEGPVPGPSDTQFVCRNPTQGASKVTLTAGGTTTVQWGFGAAHQGDCALFMSYDVSLSNLQQKYFKIANFPDCNVDNNIAVTINLPAWLKNGAAIMRWDWYALHVFPKIEFYNQCVDVTITSGNAELPASVQLYTIPGIYPATGDQAAGQFWNPYNNPVWKMEGPACAGNIEGNCCDVSGYTLGTGYMASTCRTSGSSTGAPTTTPVSSTAAPTVTPGTPTTSPTTSPPTTAMVSECVIYTVENGDTMSLIASNYEGITWQSMCVFNRPGAVGNEAVECSQIAPGDNLVIPNEAGDSCLKNVLYQNPQTPTATDLDSGALGTTISSCGLLVILIAMCAL